MAAPTFEIDGQTYAIARMATMAQMEVARRYGNVLVFVGEVRAKTEAQYAALKADPATAATAKPVTPASMGQALILAAAQVPVVDQGFVSNTALAAVSRIVGGRASPVIEVGSGRLMFEDITPAALCEMIYRVLEQHGLIDFFADPPSTSPGAPPA